MLAKIYSAAVSGVDAYEVEIEVNGAGGDPVIVIVGLPDNAVKESRDRVTTAISNSGYYWPRGRTTINLAPADIKKEGLSFDLPIALGMIAVTEELNSSPFENFSFVGELALDGSVRPVKGVLPVALEARRRANARFSCPKRMRSKPRWSIKSTFTACRICGKPSRFCVAKLRFCRHALI
jgi:magnesium chelatase family protein